MYSKLRFYDCESSAPTDQPGACKFYFSGTPSNGTEPCSKIVVRVSALMHRLPKIQIRPARETDAASANDADNAIVAGWVSTKQTGTISRGTAALASKSPLP